MRSPYQRIVVYDLETGGLASKYNSITEIAMVAIDLENLEIIDEASWLLRPRLDLSNREEEPRNEAKLIFKALATQDPETKIKTLQYKGKGITLKNLDEFTDDIEEFYLDFLKVHGNIIEYNDIQALQGHSTFNSIINIYFDYCYNPQALEATHIPKELIIKEGMKHEDAFKGVSEFLAKHTIGNSKPILAGHNIKNFDNAFFEKFFVANKKDLYKVINQTKMIDTLEEARIKWYELPNYTLSSCVNAVGLTLKDAHRALPDTVANANLLIKMLQSLRGEGSQESTYERRKFKFNF